MLLMDILYLEMTVTLVAILEGMEVQQYTVKSLFALGIHTVPTLIG